MESPPIRTLRQRNLRILAGIVSVFLCFTVWTATRLTYLFQTKSIISEVNGLGGWVRTDPVCPESLLKSLPETVREWVAQWKHVTRITVSGSQVTSAHLAKFGKLILLEELCLTGCNVTDDDLANLSGLTNLKYLYIAGTSVTDAGLVHLRGMKKLTHFYPANSRVTGSGISKFRRYHPDCHIGGF